MDSDSPKPDGRSDQAELDEQLVAYLDGELDEDTAREVETLVSENPKLQERLEELEQSWAMLDQLDRDETEGAFTENTLEMVALQAEADAEQQAARLPGLRRRRFAMTAAGLLVAGCVGFAAVAMLRPDPNRELLDNLPIIQNVDEYLQILGNDDTVEDNVEFLKKLHEAQLFSDDDAETAEVEETETGGNHDS